ncbi:MAG: protein-L-isoaspartate O-methyltransferase family protein, partial [Planctomycetaceae bacterium]
PELSQRAGEVLRRLGCQNVELVVGDGTLGVPEKGPYDGIVVTAGAPEFPRTLFGQLREGGRLVIPVGEGFQVLQTIRKRHGQPQIDHVCECRFVPLIGVEGLPESRDRSGSIPQKNPPSPPAATRTERSGVEASREQGPGAE